MSCLKRLILCGAISSLLALPASAALEGYWPLNETSGGSALNLVGGGTAASLFGGATWITDPIRGQVLSFDGAIGSYADAGMIPAMTINSNFTWSFWVRNGETALTTNTILGNRYSDANGEYSPREFIKFTTQQFEFHVNAAAQNVNYPDLPLAPDASSMTDWFYMTLVKDGNKLISYRNGLVNGIQVITGTPINPQPLFFGGDRNRENWKGRLDDVAIWTNALPTSSVGGLASGAYTPLTAPLIAPAANYTTVLSENFSGSLATKWNVTQRGLESTGEAGYHEPSTAGGVLSLGGTMNYDPPLPAKYWYGTSIESKERFSSLLQTQVTVDRISLTGSGTAYRSSIWILGDNGHYLHFSQNISGGGWGWNAKDDGGVGTLLPTGNGNNIASLDPFDADLGQFKLQLEIIPTGIPGSVNIFMYVNDTMVAGQGFSAFPESFQVILSGQSRAMGDSVEAVFDNLIVQQQVPEPSTALLLLGGTLAACGLRRRRR